jgi:hypothetical protein
MSAYLIDFTTAFNPAPAFYTGSGATTLVPNVFLSLSTADRILLI